MEALPDQLEEYLRAVARTGDSLLPRTSKKPLFQRKLALVLDAFILNPDSQSPDAFDATATGMRTRLLQRLDSSFDTCPFILQRLSELLTTPRQQYNRIDKFWLSAATILRRSRPTVCPRTTASRPQSPRSRALRKPRRSWTRRLPSRSKMATTSKTRKTRKNLPKNLKWMVR
ncbi:serine/threonine-protein phosphatase 4 regulatory subunit 2-like [Cloeon dipterum]|uniref:serine/threonine-protein phosphatase 4 regulatory subunit 2-like n=1 Tax=Cloeon dipterum TaxID=197152 RepID=UPI0032202D19